MIFISDVLAKFPVGAQAQGNRGPPETPMGRAATPPRVGESPLMPRECCKKILPLLNANAPTLSGKRQRAGRHFLSAEGRILSVIIQSDKAIMKDIPRVTGISFRSCYEIISKLSALGVIEKRAHSSDRRAIRLAVNQPKLCKHFCRRPPSE